ncbi:MAG TPA: diiron oxygenase [Acidimicrobiales bacterium]|jgi:hypothetical protein
MLTKDVDQRVDRLNSASLRRVIEPDHALPGQIGTGQILPDDLLSVAGLDLDLTPEQKAVLSREEVASIAQAGVNFEAVLMAGFSLRVVDSHDLTDPRVSYLLHEVGEETRHSRLFVRMIEQLEPTAKNPFARGIQSWLMRRGVRRVISLPSLFFTLVLGGEEIPDLVQKLACEHPDTDPFVREVNRYHRQEEARHLAFARIVLPETWRDASVIDRLAVKFVAPLIVGQMFDQLVHPGVYETVGLPGFDTWKRVRQLPKRVALRHEATRSVLRALVDAEVLVKGRIPRGWQRLCGVDRSAEPTS